MIMRSPAQAMLWEIWRVTRVESAWKLALGLVASLAVMGWAAALAPADGAGRARDFYPAIALACIVGPHFMGWMFVQRLNGHRPGFPLHLLFTRPVRTGVMVGLPLLYLTLAPALAYLFSAMLLRAVTGLPFPLLQVAAWIAMLNLAMTVVSWSTRRTSATTLLSMIPSAAWMILASVRLAGNPDGSNWHDSPAAWPAIFDFPATDYLLIAVLAMAFYAVAVAKVARQRRGETPAKANLFWVPGRGYPEWLVSLFRVPCPVSSGSSAQLWFELKTRGLPVLAIGLMLALIIPLLFTLGVAVDAVVNDWPRLRAGCSERGCFYGRPMSGMVAGLATLAILAQGGNAFGLRWKPGRAYLSPFEAVQPIGSARIAIIKLLARSACFFLAVTAVAGSAWLSLPILGDGVFVQVLGGPLSAFREMVHAGLTALGLGGQLALAATAVIGSLVWVASFGAVGALWIRFPRQGNVLASSVLLLALALPLLWTARAGGVVPASLVDAIYAAVRGLALAALAGTAGYVLWRGFAERVLSTWLTGAVFAISAVFTAAWLTLSPSGGTASTSPVDLVAPLLWPALVSLTALLLVPWSFHRLRHM